VAFIASVREESGPFPGDTHQKPPRWRTSLLPLCREYAGPVSWKLLPESGVTSLPVPLIRTDGSYVCVPLTVMFPLGPNLVALYLGTVNDVSPEWDLKTRTLPGNLSRGCLDARGDKTGHLCCSNLRRYHCGEMIIIMDQGCQNELYGPSTITEGTDFVHIQPDP